MRNGSEGGEGGKGKAEGIRVEPSLQAFSLSVWVGAWTCADTLGHRMHRNTDKDADAAPRVETHTDDVHGLFQFCH